MGVKDPPVGPCDLGPPVVSPLLLHGHYGWGGSVGTHTGPTFLLTACHPTAALGNPHALPAGAPSEERRPFWKGRPGPERRGAGRPPAEEGEATVVSDESHLGRRNVAGEGFWRLEAFHFWCLALHKLLQEMMFSQTKLSLAPRHQSIPCKQPPPAEGRPKYAGA